MSVAYFEDGMTVSGPPTVVSYEPPERCLDPWMWGTDRKKVLLQTAHPDDETLFAGGIMLTFPEWEWHLVCLTGNEDRRRQYDIAVDAFRREGVNIVSTRNHEFEDRYRPGDRRLWLAALAKEDTTSWDMVITHGFRGEYGHHHHVWLNMIAHLLYENVWDFWQPRSKVEQLCKTQVVAVPTDPRKLRIFDYAYGHIATGLRENAPWLVQPMLDGEREFFTQGVLGL